MTVMPDTVNNLPIPVAMRDLFERRAWPAGLRIDTLPIAENESCKFLLDIDLDLLPSASAMDQETCALADLVQNQDLRVGAGSQASQPVLLPWLDIEKALCIGSGSDYGDDLWLMLDYRECEDNPRIVANEFAEDGSCYWRELSPSFSEFAVTMGLSDGNWRPGRFGTSRFSVHYHESKPWWKFW